MFLVRAASGASCDTSVMPLVSNSAVVVRMLEGSPSLVPNGRVKTLAAHHGCGQKAGAAAVVLMSEACRVMQTSPKSAASAGSMPSTSNSMLTPFASPTASVGRGVEALEEVNFEVTSREVQEWSPQDFEFQRTLERPGGILSYILCTPRT